MSQAAAVDLSKYIEMGKLDVRPHIRGRRVTVAQLAYTARREKWDIAELAYQFTLSEAEVLAALLYYHEHRATIDAQEAEERATMDALYRQYGS